MTPSTQAETIPAGRHPSAVTSVTAATAPGSSTSQRCASSTSPDGGWIPFLRKANSVRVRRAARFLRSRLSKPTSHRQATDAAGPRYVCIASQPFGVAARCSSALFSHQVADLGYTRNPVCQEEDSTRSDPPSPAGCRTTRGVVSGSCAGARPHHRACPAAATWEHQDGPPAPRTHTPTQRVLAFRWSRPHLVHSCRPPR